MRALALCGGVCTTWTAAAQNFRVAAAICGVPELPSVDRLVATQTPVILLAGEDIDWGGPEVTVVSRRAPAARLVCVVRQLAAAARSATQREVPAENRPA